MADFPDSVQALIDAFKNLPGIGPKTAERFVFYLLQRDQTELDALAQRVGNLKKTIVRCSVCYDTTDADPCRICGNNSRDATIIAVVASSPDRYALEKTGKFNGRYHVLGGVLNPIDGITPDKLEIASLLKRLQTSQPPVREVLLALNTDLEGESTALYLAKQLKETNVKVTRLAKGLPMGSDLEFADDITLQSAIENRLEISEKRQSTNDKG